MKYLILIVFFFISCAPNSTDNKLENVKYKYPFQDPSLTIDERVNDLITRLTVEEKIDQLMYTAPAVERLGIPEYNWWNEALHGVARNGRATVFPQAIGMAATFDPALINQVASAISDEARAKYNLFSAKDRRGQYQGLTFWTPNVNIFRDPRWGRGHETYGEDPFLTSEIGKAFVRGLQGDHPKYLQSAALAKHYAVHSGPEGLRHEIDVTVSMKDMWETYLPAFEALVTEANVEGVMGAYNRVNGDACNAHPYLMDEVLRSKWGFDGYFTTDCWALVDFYNGHKLVSTEAEAAAMALKAGVNLNCGSIFPFLNEALSQGLITENDIDQRLKELLPTRFKLGLFDPAEMVPWSKYGSEKIRSAENVALTRKIAASSIVLLKNENNTLPISKEVEQVYVTGPMATHAQALLANYYGVSENLVTILEGVVGKVSDETTVLYNQGALLDRPNINPIDWFSEDAEKADVTIACLGISQLIEGEEGEAIASPGLGDRIDIGLPKNQLDFLKILKEKAKKLVVVITAGSALAMPEVMEIADAVLYVWYPGEQGGNAVADILFGDYSPSGRLPISFPYSLDDLPAYEDYEMKNRTYRYLEKPPLLPFGFGLTYTTFEYSNIQLSSREITQGNAVTASVDIKNTGSIEADEIIQLYVKDLEAGTKTPLFALKGIQKVSLSPGESMNIQFEITDDMLALVNDQGASILEPGEFVIYIGGSSPDIRNQELGASTVLSTTLTLN